MCKLRWKGGIDEWKWINGGMSYSIMFSVRCRVASIWGFCFVHVLTYRSGGFRNRLSHHVATHLRATRIFCAYERLRARALR